MGCSTGGYLDMIEAQRFPWDFDGIITGDPDMDEADLLMRLAASPPYRWQRYVKCTRVRAMLPASDSVEMAAIYDYYDTVEKLMGGRVATQSFFRVYMVPGMGHCGGGEGADQIDYLGYLEAWVERGEAPNRMIGAHAGTAAGAPASFTRPAFPYPQYARNFIAVTPESR